MNQPISLSEAKNLDANDPLACWRQEFCFPISPKNKKPYLYFCGNSLGLKAKRTDSYLKQELDDWGQYGVEAHFRGKNPWFSYHEILTPKIAQIVGAHNHEVVCMNSLTVNLHLMLVSFYRPTSKRFKILIEKGAFPSDQYAVASQAKFHGFDAHDAVVELEARPGEATLRTLDIENKIAELGESLALVMLGGVNYLTGQAFDMQAITFAGHEVGAKVGFDLAHAAGNLLLKLHDWQIDFAVWCSYKYLNSGPGGIAGVFVHERHAQADLPKFAGWWGHDKNIRFQMGDSFKPMYGAESWQLSNPPIFQLASLHAACDVFLQAGGMPALREKSKKLTAFLHRCVDQVFANPELVITPKKTEERGAQLSFRIPNASGQDLQEAMLKQGVIVDFRQPDIIRAAPVPLYNSFEDVYFLTQKLAEVLK